MQTRKQLAIIVLIAVAAGFAQEMPLPQAAPQYVQPPPQHYVQPPPQQAEPQPQPQYVQPPPQQVAPPPQYVQPPQQQQYVQPPPPQQQQYVQPPPPPQPQYVQPPPPQYVYPPPQQVQPQYIYPPPQGQYIYVAPSQTPQYIYVAQPVLYQQKSGNFSTGQRFGTWFLNTIIPGLGSAAIMNDYVGMGIQIGLTTLGITSIAALGWKEECHGYSTYCYQDETVFLPIGIGLLGFNQLFSIVRSASYDKPNDDVSEEYNTPTTTYVNQSGAFSTGQRFGTWFLNIIFPGLGSAAIMGDYAGMGVQMGLTALGIISLTDNDSAPLGVFLLAGNFIFNIIRSSSYEDDDVNNEYSGLNLTVLPNRHGEIMPALMYRTTF